MQLIHEGNWRVQEGLRLVLYNDVWEPPPPTLDTFLHTSESGNLTRLKIVFGALDCISRTCNVWISWSGLLINTLGGCQGGSFVWIWIENALHDIPLDKWAPNDVNTHHHPAVWIWDTTVHWISIRLSSSHQLQSYGSSPTLAHPVLINFGSSLQSSVKSNLNWGSQCFHRNLFQLSHKSSRATSRQADSARDSSW